MFYGVQLVAARKLAGLTCAELARRVGISRIALLDIEHDRYEPTPEHAERILAVLADAGVRLHISGNRVGASLDLARMARQCAAAAADARLAEAGAD